SPISCAAWAGVREWRGGISPSKGTARWPRARACCRGRCARSSIEALPYAAIRPPRPWLSHSAGRGSPTRRGASESSARVACSRRARVSLLSTSAAQAPQEERDRARADLAEIAESDEVASDAVPDGFTSSGG